MQRRARVICWRSKGNGDGGGTVISRFPPGARVHNASMDFVLTDHAKEEARRRQIPLEWIESTMAHPEQMTPGTNRRKVLQSRIVTDGKTYLVRLVVEDWHQPPVIVTAYRTSKIDKYWGKT